MAAQKPQSRARKRAGVQPFAEEVVEGATTEEEPEEIEEEETDDEEPDEEVIEEEEEIEELEEEEAEEEAEQSRADFAPFIHRDDGTNWNIEDIFEEVVHRGFAVIYDTTDEGLSAGVQWFKVIPVKVGEISEIAASAEESS
jgi:hypothetical protein